MSGRMGEVRRTGIVVTPTGVVGIEDNDREYFEHESSKRNYRVDPIHPS